jgi:hypothetical protein
MVDILDEDVVESEEEEDTEEEAQKDNVKFCKFLSEHPLHESHHVYCVDEKFAKIPVYNVQGTLPRHDVGDREYYCSVMLTLFVPWRSGYDLKKENQTWDESFLDHDFSERQQEFMKFYNLRYECLDARDDYSAQMKQNQTSGFFP